jgi:membrane protein implicated in regulation of membrane protease activity
MQFSNLIKIIRPSSATNSESSYYSPLHHALLIQDVRQDQKRVATVVKDIHFGRRGRISYAGTEWFAATLQSSASFSLGDQVYVVGRQEGTNMILVERYQRT